MGNSRKPEGSGGKGKKKKLLKKNMEAYFRRTGQTASDAAVAARRAIAITRGGVEAAERIRDRALTQRDASRAETAEAKDSVRAISLEQKSQLSLEQDLRHESEAALVKALSDLQEEQQRARKLEAGRAASEARAAELGKTLAKVRCLLYTSPSPRDS